MTNENDPERKTQMKKITSIILAIIMTFAVLALAACNNTGNGDSTTTATPAGTTAPEAPKTDATTSAEKPAIESAAAFYTKVWGALTDDQKSRQVQPYLRERRDLQMVAPCYRRAYGTDRSERCCNAYPHDEHQHLLLSHGEAHRLLQGG